MAKNSSLPGNRPKSNPPKNKPKMAYSRDLPKMALFIEVAVILNWRLRLEIWYGFVWFGINYNRGGGS